MAIDGLISAVPIKMDGMSIFSLISFVAIVFIFYLVYIQIRKDSKECRKQYEENIKNVIKNHDELEDEFKDTREKLYDKINEVKDAFGDINVTVARTEQMIKNNADIQKIMQKDIGEIRERLNK